MDSCLDWNSTSAFLGPDSLISVSHYGLSIVSDHRKAEPSSVVRKVRSVNPFCESHRRNNTGLGKHSRNTTMPSNVYTATLLSTRLSKQSTNSFIWFTIISQTSCLLLVLFSWTLWGLDPAPRTPCACLQMSTECSYTRGSKQIQQDNDLTQRHCQIQPPATWALTLYLLCSVPSCFCLKAKDKTKLSQAAASDLQCQDSTGNFFVSLFFFVSQHRDVSFGENTLIMKHLTEKKKTSSPARKSAFPYSGVGLLN